MKTQVGMKEGTEMYSSSTYVYGIEPDGSLTWVDTSTSSSHITAPITSRIPAKSKPGMTREGSRVSMEESTLTREFVRMESKGRKKVLDEIFKLFPADGALLTMVRVGGKIMIMPVGIELEDGRAILYDTQSSSTEIPRLTGIAKPETFDLDEYFAELESRGVDAGAKEKSTVDKPKVPEYAVGWYQDSAGVLSRYDGYVWMPRLGKDVRVATDLEFLGELEND